MGIIKRISLNKTFIINKTYSITKSILSIFAFFASIFSFDDFVNRDKSNLLQNLFSFFLFVFILIVILFLIFSIYALFINKRKITDFSNNHSLIVMFGDIFRLPKNDSINVIIPVNRCFDTIVDDELISNNTLHGIFLKKLFCESNFNQETLNSHIQNNLKKSDFDYEVLEEKDKKKGNLKRYQLGTVVEIKSSNVNYFLVGLSKFDYNLHAMVNEKEYLFCMSEILEYIEKHSQGYKTYIPLIGAGHSAIYQDEQMLLEFMLKLIQLNKRKVNCDITIVLSEKSKSRISIL
ncbi:macro domain-containing protein [Streptococcus parauberis]|uniref:macro domain-containing protein n=1 Tax=Streptococcus parauberis TaxID=1348 RepID=UPI0037B646C4